MPRPAGAARKNPHATRHENGLVFPGKKIVKQKSTGNLNGNPNGPQQSGSTSPSRRPATSAVPPMTAHVANGTPDGATAAGDLKMEANGQVQVNSGCGNDDPVLSNGHAYSPNGGVGPTARFDEPSRRPEKATGMAPALKKVHSTNSVNPLHLASTILKACPMSDTIAILIFLLQLPPIVLTLVQFLYASMTFMLPAGVTTGTLTSNFDIFQGPAGTPSLSTMIAMDGFCLLVWGLFMWNWARNFAIDLAHVQVAIALGAGSSGDTGGVNVFCITVVLISHLLRSEGIQNFVTEYLLSAKIVSVDSLTKYSYLIPAEFRRKGPSSPPSWIRSLLAVHILAQAGTAIARRSMAKNRSPAKAKTGKRADTEASAGSQVQVESSGVEPSNALPSSAPSDSILPNTTVKDSREKVTSAKKRRRQANEARRIQPFWAALASTKLTVTREYERSTNGNWYSPNLPIAEDDVDGASLDSGCIWITSVDSCSIKFAASDFSSSMDDSAVGGMLDDKLPNIEPDPFYVRVNGAHWAPVSLSKIPKESSEPALVHWRGEISGLAPDCAYTCSFVRFDTDEQICVMSVKTPTAPDTDQALSTTPSVSPSPRPSLRPSSPTTTIRNSIVNADARLNERRSRLKRARNDHKIHISKVKKELDNFNNRLQSGSDDGRQKQRSLQLERTIRQTEEATVEIEVLLDSMRNIPESELQEWSSWKATFDLESDKVKALKLELEAAKIEMNRAVVSTEAELATTMQKRERLQSRRNRLSEQYERITSANNQGLNDRERRVADQLAKEREHARIEEGFHEQLTSITRSVQDIQARTSQLWQQTSTLEQAIQQQQLLMQGPLTPEGELPGTQFQAQPDTSSVSMAPLLSGTRSSLGGAHFSPFANPTDRTSFGGFQQTSSSPVPALTSLFSNADQSCYPSSPLANNTAHIFGLDHLTQRDRSSSNLSGPNNLDYINQPFPTDSADGTGTGIGTGIGTDIATGTVTGTSSPDNTRNPASAVPYNVAQFNRACSRNSGSASGSGSGSGSGTGSPHSARGKLA